MLMTKRSTEWKIRGQGCLRKKRASVAQEEGTNKLKLWMKTGRYWQELKRKTRVKGQGCASGWKIYIYL